MKQGTIDRFSNSSTTEKRTSKEHEKTETEVRARTRKQALAATRAMILSALVLQFRETKLMPSQKHRPIRS